ncbi:MAG: sigma-70 family RNA polymerase sigma factor [Planctomycetota bacterium]|nr:sigma-70 family RNA polymerase sigma factor [Planctomycetota bacterium]
MNDSAVINIENWLCQAKSGNIDALGRLLSAYMNYLKTLAHAQMDDRLRRRVGASDIVQETLLEAHRDFLHFVGKSPAEFNGWLRTILINNLKRAIECHLMTAKRDVRRELSLEDLKGRADQSAARLEAFLAAPNSSVSSDMQRHEALIRLSDSIARLSEEHREIIILRHVRGLPFKDIAEQLNKTSGAVRMIWMRAIEKLRETSVSSTGR